MILPVIKVMKAIGYERAIVLYGGIKGSDKGIDEASVSGPTLCAELFDNGKINEYEFSPADFGMKCHDPLRLAPAYDIQNEAKDFVDLMQGKQSGARKDAALLNAGLVYYIAGLTDDIKSGLFTGLRISFFGA